MENPKKLNTRSREAATQQATVVNPLKAKGAGRGVGALFWNIHACECSSRAVDPFKGGVGGGGGHCWYTHECEGSRSD